MTQYNEGNWNEIIWTIKIFELEIKQVASKFFFFFITEEKVFPRKYYVKQTININHGHSSAKAVPVTHIKG